MLISVKQLTKYVIIIYALGSVHEKSKPFQSSSKGENPGRARRKELTAKPLQIETGVPN